MTNFLIPYCVIPRASGTARAISEIITQADVRIKKLVRTPAFLVFGVIAEPKKKTKKTRVRTHAKRHDPQSLHGQRCEVRTLFLSGLYPIFLSCKLAFTSFQKRVLSQFKKLAGALLPNRAPILLALERLEIVLFITM